MLRDASLGRRLLLGAAAFIAVALIIATILIGFVLHRFIQGQIDQRLDTHLLFLASMLRGGADGTLVLDGSADGPPFDRPRRGWYWQISGPRNVLRARALVGMTLDLPPLHDPSRPSPPPPDRKPGPAPSAKPLPGDGPGPDQEALHFRVRRLSVDGVQATIVVTSPRDAVMGPLREAMTTLGLSLLVLGAALVVAMLLQVRLGLRPLEHLRRALAEVRTGQRERVPAEQPAEIRPLVSEVNGLLAENQANLERARRHVANLAHGLKTPLATLAVALPADRELHDLIDQMDRRIRHHLGRARAAALSGPVRLRTPIAARIADLGRVLAKVHADKPVRLSSDVSDHLAVACEPQDFDEIAGNLLENAFKWTRLAVSVRARTGDARMVVITVDDDGPGLSAVQIPKMLRPGQRLDEAAPGFGFGLSITRELVELYGGTLDLGASPQGGLGVTVTLPMAVAGSAAVSPA